MNPSFTEIDFYDYKIRVCNIDGTKMYLVSDLLRQYNEKHETEKSFKHYLENKQTQELLRKRYEKTVGPNSDLPSKEGQNEGSNTVRENSPVPSNDDKWNIPHVIQVITTPDFNGTNKGYIVCEELLHACLMWTDPVFACDVYSFLTRLREQDNDYLKRH